MNRRDVILGATALAGYRWKSGAILPRRRATITLAILDEMKATIEEMGARPAFAYLPAYGEIDRTDPGMTGQERFFFSYCRRSGIQSMYLRPYFLRSVKEGVALKTHGHWGPLEHRIAAEGIRAYLVDKDLCSGIRPSATSRAVANPRAATGTMAAPATRPRRPRSSAREQHAAADRHRHHREVVVLEQEVEGEVQPLPRRGSPPRPAGARARAPRRASSRPPRPEQRHQPRSEPVGELARRGGQAREGALPRPPPSARPLRRAAAARSG